jgi:GxxExxY protein
MAYDSGDPVAEELIAQVIDSAVEVHRHLGPGLLEKHYENALCHEFDLRRIPYTRQVRVRLDYKGKDIGEGVVDLVVGGRLIVELKAIEGLTDLHFAQVISYLNIQKLRLGVLLNFNVVAMNAKGAIRRVLNKLLRPKA